METATLPRTFRLVLGGLRVRGEQVNGRLHVRMNTDRKVPEGLSRGPAITFDLDARDALALAVNLKSHANAILEASV